MPQEPIASARTLLTLYDLTFFFCLHGPRIRRGVVVEYLARATGGTRATPASQARSFERAKQHLSRLGVRLDSETVPTIQGSESWIVLRAARRAKTKIETLLDAPLRSKKAGRRAG